MIYDGKSAFQLKICGTRMKFFFCIVSGSRGLLKLDIIVCQPDILTHILSFSENLENYKKVIYYERLHFN